MGKRVAERTTKRETERTTLRETERTRKDECSCLCVIFCICACISAWLCTAVCSVFFLDAHCQTDPPFYRTCCSRLSICALGRKEICEYLCMWAPTCVCSCLCSCSTVACACVRQCVFGRVRVRECVCV